MVNRIPTVVEHCREKTALSNDCRNLRSQVYRSSAVADEAKSVRQKIDIRAAYAVIEEWAAPETHIPALGLSAATS
jgi:hypothetical protein